MANPELLNCPFCGSEAHTQPGKYSYAVWIGCSNGTLSGGTCRMSPSSQYHSEAEAIAAWNTRAESPSELLEALKEAISTLAASRHLIGKYVPDHSWLPEHDKRIAALKSAISRAEGLGVEGGDSGARGRKAIPHASPERWHAVATYHTENGPLTVEHDVEELEDLHNLIERGPDWNSLDNIHVTLSRSTGRTTVEQSER